MSQRDSIDLKTVLILGAVGGAAYLILKALNVGEKAVDKVSTAIAKAYLKLFPMPPATQLLGNVKFPGNLLVSLQQLHNEKSVFRDDNGNVYVKYSGYTWQLAPQIYGNWPATRVD